MTKNSDHRRRIPVFKMPRNGSIVAKSENRYTERVKHTCGGTLLALLLTLTLASCGSTDDEQGITVAVRSARNGVDATASGLTGFARSRPGPLIGAYAALFLLDRRDVPFRSAIEGVNAQVRLHITTAEQKSETYALLQELGAALQVDINDLLNRSENRRATLDLYIASLRDLLQRSVATVTRLEEQQNTVQDTLRDQRREVSHVRSTLNRALRDEDYASAGARQQELSVRQTELTQTELQNEEIDGTLEVFGDLIEVGGERLTAIEKNREVIISGLKVIDVPGIEDIGVIRDETREERRNRRRRVEDSVFGEPL